MVFAKEKTVKSQNSKYDEWVRGHVTTFSTSYPFSFA